MAFPREIYLLFCTWVSSSTLCLGSTWWFVQQTHPQTLRRLPAMLLKPPRPAPVALPPSPSASTPRPSSTIPKTEKSASRPPIPPALKASSPSPAPTPQPNVAQRPSPQPTPPALVRNWQQKAVRGIYLSRYQITNNASEQTIRERVRYYRQKGFNTLIHGVWGNGCTMYDSRILQQYLDLSRCPNQFQAQWLDWLIDEAHQQGMEVHAYFEKGIKIDRNSPIFQRAIDQQWLVPGVDKTYAKIDHYVLDVEIPEVARLFRDISVEFVQKYPQIDAVQWDDYLGYHAELPGKIDRTAKLTQFVRQITQGIKRANPQVKFDLSHHNPYWAKRYFAADWQNWQPDRVFIQAYNDANFAEEMAYAQQYHGIAITDHQFHRLATIINNPQIDSIMIFPLAQSPEKTASLVHQSLQAPAAVSAKK